MSRLKHWNNGKFNKTLLRYWNGKKWLYPNLKRWNGTEWESCIKKPVNDFFLDSEDNCLVKPNGELVREYPKRNFDDKDYYYKNKMCYKRIIHNFTSSTPWNIEIQLHDPWKNKIIKSVKIPHIHTFGANSDSIFYATLTVTKDKVWVFYTDLTNVSYYSRHGCHVICLDLELNIIAHTLSANGSSIKSGRNSYVPNTNSEMLNSVDFSKCLAISTNQDDFPTIYDYATSIDYDSGVSKYVSCGTWAYSDIEEGGRKEDFKGGVRYSWRAILDEYTPIYDWYVNMYSGKSYFNENYIPLSPPPNSKGGNALRYKIEPFDYCGNQSYLNNKVSYGYGYGTREPYFLDYYVYALKKGVSLEWVNNEGKYLTFRDIWGNPSYGYVTYGNTGGVNLSNLILGATKENTEILFKRLPNGKSLIYLNNYIFTLVQKNDKFHFDFYGMCENIENIKKAGEVFTCYKEVIE